MSKPQQLQNNVEFVRCNQRILRETHPDLYEHFSKIHEKGRAEEMRYLMRLGLMVKNGQLNGWPVQSVQQPLLQEIPSSVPDATVESISANANLSSNTVKPQDENTLNLGESDLDFGDDLLDLD
ncbi:hypothetical protein HPY09_20170 (plasmid) [Vibrio cholerae]|uniref:hypothetical protein n=1 Tax=Vibrio cholerae TaxID=666 RepID=UPI001183F045|nr:hypothetical protein [Vibrio cholerae]HBC3550292.1 hypothetical protein [Vibrio parahaemolyticus]EJL6462182.1 hypothetical protein [Vibrio cholerae]MBJ6953074.1 hypothetical protein [Vibrio cholerae]MVC22429.1 hypothetical protein [Vibrio cholerae]QKU73257.1 hypothetical protein HPY09_20170 [Vibrio cholerae]